MEMIGIGIRRSNSLSFVYNLCLDESQTYITIGDELLAVPEAAICTILQNCFCWLYHLVHVVTLLL